MFLPNARPVFVVVQDKTGLMYSAVLKRFTTEFVDARFYKTAEHAQDVADMLNEKPFHNCRVQLFTLSIEEVK